MNSTTNRATTNSGSFSKWLDALLGEKGIYMDDMIEVEGPSGLNIMSVEDVVDAMKRTTPAEQKAIQTMLVKIDFVNGDVRRYLRHLAQAIAL